MIIKVEFTSKGQKTSPKVCIFYHSSKKIYISPGCENSSTYILKFDRFCLLMDTGGDFDNKEICKVKKLKKLKLHIFMLITVRNEVAKVMFLQVSVCPHGGGGVCLSACWDTTSQSRHPPHEIRSLLRTVRILLECILVLYMT